MYSLSVHIRDAFHFSLLTQDWGIKMLLYNIMQLHFVIFCHIEPGALCYIILLVRTLLEEPYIFGAAFFCLTLQ